MAGTQVFPSALELREVAARVSFDRIERDLARVPVKLRPLLEHIQDHLFSPTLNVQSLKRECGMRDNSVSTAFGRATGLPPRSYMEARRLETAECLLSDTPLPINQIGELVGFSSEAVFYRAFRRWRGVAPSAFRVSARVEGEVRAVDCLRPEDVRRALRGRASSDETQALITALAAVQGTSPKAPAPLRGAPPTADLESPPIADAEALWDEIRGLDPKVQRVRIRQLRDLRIDLAELLFERSRTEGRDDRKHGVHIAELAVECLYPGGRALEHVEPEALAILRARAWAWFANAHRLALDFIEADKALEVAKRTLPESVSESALVEVLEIESAVRLSQGRFEDAYATLENAATLVGRIQSHRRVARLEVQRAAIALDLGRAADAIQAAQSALMNLAQDPDAYLEVTAYQRLIAALIQVDRLGEAAALLPAGRRIAAAQSAKYLATQHRWLEGQLWRKAGRIDLAIPVLEDALQAFVSSGETFYSALVTLDLALSHIQVGADQAAIRACSEAIPLLQALGAHRETLAAVGILRQSVSRQTIGIGTLRDLRTKLGRAMSQIPASS